MRKLASILLPLVLFCGCGSWHRSTAPVTNPAAESLAAEASISGPVVTLTDAPTTITVPVQLNRPPLAAEVSDDPLVRLLSDLLNANSNDAVTAKQINQLPGNDDQIMMQCTNWLGRPDTLQRVVALANLKTTLRIVPVKPVGPLSAIAEVRRVERDIVSGALAERLAASRKDRDDLRVAFTMACGPMLVDINSAPVRFGAVVAAARAKVVLP